MLRKPVVNNNGHRPIEDGDKLVPEAIPVSQVEGNGLSAVEDGLFISSLSAPATRVFVDPATGVDDEQHGQRATPFKTLMYALHQLNSTDIGGAGFSRVGGTFTVMLMVGQTYVLSESVELAGVTLQFGFYGDDRGDWDTQINSTTLELAADVARPVINNMFVTNPQTNLIEATRLFSRNQRWPSAVEFHGVHINLAETSATNLGVVDIIDGPDVLLVGSIVNKTGLGPSGFMAVRSTHHSTFTQFASQFKIINRLINKSQGQDGITFADLEARSMFVKFYLGLGGVNYQWDRLLYSPQALNSSNASGLLDLHWHDTIEQASDGLTTMASYPTLSDLNFGMGKYIQGLRRDQQGRSINVHAGRLI